MEAKKNPNVDLNRNSGLYFVIGLTVVLFATWRLLEIKTYDSQEEFVTVLNVQDDMNEDVPVTEMIRTTPPPPPPSAPEVIEIVEDIEEVEETVIESTESSQETYIEDAIVRMDDLDMEEVEEDISVPFAVIEKVPVFPGCEGLNSEAEKKECFNQKVQEHIKKNFKYPQTALEMGISGRVFLQFEIDKKGEVANLRYRGPDRMLEEEAARIINSLPKMKPGQQRGQPVKVGYSIPINFIMKE